MFMALTETCTIENKISEDGYGNIIYGDSVQIKCQYHEESERDDEGSIIITEGWVILPADAKINYDSKITLPSGSQPSIKKIKKIINYRLGTVEGVKIEFKWGS